MYYKAAQLDARNIGSVIGVNEDGEDIYGTISSIIKGEKVRILLDDGETTLNLSRSHSVDIILGQTANWSMQTQRVLADHVVPVLAGREAA